LGITLSDRNLPRLWSRGFTLIEVLVVLAIMAMVYALALPAIGRASTSLEMKSATRQIAAGLRRARGQAVTRRHEAVLSLDLDGKLFRITDDPHTYTLPGHPDLALYTAQSEIINAKQGAIRFFADGTSTGGRITVGTGPSSQQITVNWLTGKVSIGA
jgi:general secretion pathway protein H